MEIRKTWSIFSSSTSNQLDGMNKDDVRWMPSIVKMLYKTHWFLVLYTFFLYDKESHGFNETANLLGELEVYVVTVSHLAVEHVDGNMHASWRY